MMKDVSSYIIVIFDLHEPQKLAEFDECPLFFWRVSMHLVDGVAGQVVVRTRLWWDDNPPEILGRRQEQIQIKTITNTGTSLLSKQT